MPKCYGQRTCRMASLCISCPLQAGIMSFNTPNSSFIFDRRLRSIKLCAVLRAILRPAAVVPALFCFLLLPVGAAWGCALAAVCGADTAGVASCCSSSRGFIWMILRDLVGGGGSVKSSLVITGPDCGAGRFLVVSTGEVGDTGR